MNNDGNDLAGSYRDTVEILLWIPRTGHRLGFMVMYGTVRVESQFEACVTSAETPCRRLRQGRPRSSRLKHTGFACYSSRELYHIKLMDNLVLIDTILVTLGPSPEHH